MLIFIIPLPCYYMRVESSVVSGEFKEKTIQEKTRQCNNIQN